VAHCLGELENCLSVLMAPQEPLQAARHTWRRLESMDLSSGQPEDLQRQLDQIQCDLNQLHQAIASHYFHRYQQAGVKEQGSPELAKSPLQ
jgi:uncharacterized alpha-E superfamily protein